MMKKIQLLLGVLILMSIATICPQLEVSAKDMLVTQLLTDPILMNPTDDGVSVVWFTEEEGKNNTVILYEDGKTKSHTRTIKADTILLSRIRGGKTQENCDDPSIHTNVYRHEAYVDNLPKYKGRMSEKVPYKVRSDKAESDIFSLQAKPQPGTDVKILLTSDLQGKPMCAANFEKAYETVGDVDAILANGDIVDVIDRAYDWFYADNAFFKVMTGKAEDKLGGVTYKGGAFLQNAPIYAALGNHDYMGRMSNTAPLSEQFNDPAPDDFNRITWEEVFTMPKAEGKAENYYMTTIGNLGLITLDVNRPWRLSQLGIRGRYSELIDSTSDIEGGGEFIFESVAAGSPQYEFYKKSLVSPSYRKCKYKMVMFHSPYSTLGRNGVHAFCEPVKKVVTDTVTGKKMTIFSYPKKDDLIQKNLVPLMEKNKVNLLFEAHTHNWNRFVTSENLNVLETSNVGNSYGAYYKDDTKRPDIPSAFMDDDDRSDMRKYWDLSDFALTGDLYGNEPEYPNISKLPGGKPYLSNENITAFSILDTKSGHVDSYYFDTRKPSSKVVKFDSFEL